MGWHTEISALTLELKVLKATAAGQPMETVLKRPILIWDSYDGFVVAAPDGEAGWKTDLLSAYEMGSFSTTDLSRSSRIWSLASVMAARPR
jgi:hypothetical protein